MFFHIPTNFTDLILIHKYELDIQQKEHSMRWTEFMHPSSSQLLPLKPAVSSVQYFIMKSNSIRNIEISQQKGIWSTTPSNETKLTQAFMANTFIMLIFSVQGSGHFQVSVCSSPSESWSGVEMSVNLRQYSTLELPFWAQPLKRGTFM